MPRGGARPGSGRKPKDQRTAALHGTRVRSVVMFPQRHGIVVIPPELPPSDVECPVDLADDAKVVWAQLAGHALAAGTLTVGTSTAFAMLCRAVVLERALSVTRDAGGASHRGMMQRVEAGFVRFSLAPVGKPIVKAKTEVDPFAEFEAQA